MSKCNNEAKRRKLALLAQITVELFGCDCDGSAVRGSGDMDQLPCPPECKQEDCDKIWSYYNSLWQQCLNQTCRNLVEAYYELALAVCGA